MNKKFQMVLESVKETRDYVKDSESMINMQMMSVLFSVFGYAANELHRRYFSQASKKCAGKSGSDRSKCVLKNEIEIFKKAISVLKSNQGQCKKQKDPEKCISKIVNYVKTFQKNIDDRKKQLEKYE